MTYYEDEYEPITPAGRRAAEDGVNPATVRDLDQMKLREASQFAAQQGIADLVARHPDAQRPDVAQRMIQQYQTDPRRYDDLMIADPGAACDLLYLQSQSQPAPGQPAPSLAARSGPGWDDLKPMDRHRVVDPGMSPFARFARRDALREAKARLGDDQQALRAVLTPEERGGAFFHPGFDNDAWEPERGGV